MAAKKKAKKKAGKALMTMDAYEEKFAREIAEDSTRIGSVSSTYLSINNGSFEVGDADFGTTLNVIILGFSFKNNWFDSAYVRGELNSPACAAVAMRQDEMVPSPGAPDPQATDCEACDFNAWKSADDGRGKMCDNKRVLLLIHVDDLGSKIDEIDVVKMEIPKGSVSNFDKYVVGLGRLHKRPLRFVTTEMSFDADCDYDRLKFNVIDKINSVAEAELIDQLLENNEESLLEVPDFSNYHVVTKPARGAKKKAVSRKKKARR